MITVNVNYFAALREKAGKSEEEIRTEAATALELYYELQDRYHFTLESVEISVAINDHYAALDRKLNAGDRVVFIPPVSGG